MRIMTSLVSGYNQWNESSVWTGVKQHIYADKFKTPRLTINRTWFFDREPTLSLSLSYLSSLLIDLFFNSLQIPLLIYARLTKRRYASRNWDSRDVLLSVCLSFEISLCTTNRLRDTRIADTLDRILRKLHRFSCVKFKLSAMQYCQRETRCSG